MKAPDAGEITAHWPIAGPLSIASPEHGTNKDLWHIASPDGQFFLYCVLDVRRFEREQAIRAHLDRTNLPFAIPRTFRTRSGDIAASIDGLRYAMTDLIPGAPPTYGDLEQAHACGSALASLDKAFASFDLEPGDRAGPDAATSTIPAADMLAAAFPGHPSIPVITERVQRIESEWAGVSASLPHQLVHADLYPSNVLVDQGSVSGILDFEYCGVDARVVDLAIALFTFAMHDPAHSTPWPAIGAVASGYLARLPLTEAEIAVIPLAITRREVISLRHKCGRISRQERVSEREVWRLATFLDVTSWNFDNGQHVIETVRRARS